jgi:hypothetical protein
MREVRYVSGMMSAQASTRYSGRWFGPGSRLKLILPRSAGITFNPRTPWTHFQAPPIQYVQRGPNPSQPLFASHSQKPNRVGISIQTQFHSPLWPLR